MKSKVLYLEGRPTAHLLHRRFAMSINATICFVDQKVRWQDQNKSFLFNLYAWFQNARYLAKIYTDYDLVLVDNLHFTPVLMNLFLRKKKKLVVHLGSHTLFFIRNEKYSFINLLLHRYFLSQYDFLICEGQMASQFASEILKGRTPKSYVTFLGTPAERLPLLNKISPDLTSYEIIIVANGPSRFRLFYKGLDIMIKAFEKASEQHPYLRLKILGEWSKEIMDELLSSITTEASQRIHFLGKVNNIPQHLSKTSLCIHCTRGDAFPTSTIEMLAAGIPVLVSEWTGTKELMEQIEKKMIVPMNVLEIAKGIHWYFGLTHQEKLRISLQCKQMANNYTEEKAVAHYQDTFEEIFSEINKE